jgi:hypothetical protein
VEVLDVDGVLPVMKPTAAPPALPARSEMRTKTTKFSNQDLFLTALIVAPLDSKTPA